MDAESKITSRNQTRSTFYHMLKGSILDFALKWEFGYNLADYFRENPQYATQTATSIKARLYLLEALPDQLNQLECTRQRLKGFFPTSNAPWCTKILTWRSTSTHLSLSSWTPRPQRKMVHAEVRIASIVWKS